MDSFEVKNGLIGMNKRVLLKLFITSLKDKISEYNQCVDIVTTHLPSIKWGMIINNESYKPLIKNFRLERKLLGISDETYRVKNYNFDLFTNIIKNETRNKKHERKHVRVKK
jgi:hypothetical protein